MFKRLFKIPSLVVVMLLIAQLVLPIGSAFANQASSMLPPTDLAYVNPSPEDVKLTWNAVYGATGYNVYEIQEGQLILLGTVKTNTYSIYDLPEGSYTYTISTLSGEFESGPSAPITLNVVYPSMEAPTNLSYKIQNGNDIVLNWTSSKYAQEYSIFEVLENGESNLLTTTTSNSYKNTNAAAGKYTYAVSASNPYFGESVLTDSISAEVVHPIMTRPANPTFTISNGTDVTLKWSSVPFANGYNVYQVRDGQKVLKETVTSTSLKLVNQPEGEYQYIIHSFSDRFGESEEGSEISLTVSTVVMKAPNATAKVQNFNDIYISWDQVNFADSYKVYQIVDGEKVPKDTVTRNYINYQKQESGDYHFEIHSYSDRFGESEESAKITVTVETYQLDAPQNGSVNIKNGNDLTLSWDSVTNASNYNIYQYINGEKILKDSITGTTKTYTNQPEGNYEYEIHAFNLRIGESNEGLKISTALEHPEVVPPANVEYAVTNPTSFTLSWDKAEYANSYNVYQILNGEKVLKRSVSGTSISYSNMEAGKYEYEVYAYSVRFGESKLGSKVEVTLDGYVMQAPGNLKYIILNGNDIKLEWDSVDYAASYKIYQIIDGEKKLLTTSNRNYATLSNQPEGDYEIVIHSYSYFSSQSPDGAHTNITLIHPVMDKPKGLTALIANGNDVVLSWDAVTYATSYNIYELIDGNEVLKETVSSSAKPKKTLINVIEGKHEYVIRSFSTRFGESPEGTEVEAVVDFPEMQKPENLTQTINNGNDISLKWNTAEFAKSYNIYQVKNDEKELLRTVSSTSTVLSNMPEGDYTLQVTAFSDRFGESAEASTVEFTLIFPIMQAPEDVYHTINNGNDIILRWNRAEFAKSYNIYQVVDGTKELLRTVTGTSVSFTNMPEGDYNYEVHSYSDRFGESVTASTLTIPLVHPIMQAPEDLNYIINNGNDIILKWEKSTFAKSYNIYQVKDDSKELIKTVTGTSVSFLNMAEGDYHYEVHSYSDRFDESPNSSELEFTLVWPEMQPAVLTGNVVNVNNITFTWPQVTWANGYQVYKVVGENRELLYKGNALKYAVYNLTEETHSFEVVAYSDRFGQSPASNKWTENIVYPEMQAPVASLKLTSETSAIITWNFVAYANGYNIYELIDGEPVLIAEKVNNLSYKLQNLTYANHLYYVTSYSNSFGESEPSETVLAKLIIDEEAPVTTSDVSSDWTNEDVTVILSATDNETGVASTYYSVNGSEFIKGKNFTVEDEGVHKVSFYSIDKVGNKEVVKTTEVKIDKTQPEISSDLSDNWATADVVVKLSAADQLSGVAKTYYSIDGNDFAEGTAFTVSGDGIHNVKFYSVDHAGNVEDVQSKPVKIDSQAPVTSSNIEDKWYQDVVTVELPAIDDLSGVAATYYSLDGENYTEGNEIILETDGIYEVSYYSVDNAGNIEETQIQTVNIDSENPVTADNISDLWYNKTFKVELNATDNLSTVDKTYYSINGSEFIEGTSFEVSKEGINEVVYFSIDKAGNKEVVTTTQVKVDKTAPTISADLQEEYKLGSEFAISYTAADEHSGVASEEVTINGVTYKNGDTITLDQPGVYTLSIEVTDHAGWTTQVEKEFVVYIPATLEVLPKVIKGNKGIFTVKANLPAEFAGSSFDVPTATLNGVAPKVDNNGLFRQADKGHFKFEREDFDWKPGKAELEFRAYLDNGYLVVGSAIVDVK
ncbi:Ig-like domain repeat protein [Bacillus sp. ISL-45]|uniref:OmpL47-type beta-barrel domain-containing protein n=1 Tax=Bacillus sp. ISL-45 TaxID=2819128 RepID=UPI001BE8A298|nr:Ig-like domain repeat protein [Bacillus sp. ISL-45]MBT2659658.1 Ig-like domain repeat protein [Bacillus sp. ISL-45]